MTQHLDITLVLQADPAAAPNAFIPIISVQTLNTCYHFQSISKGLPPGMLGIPEFDYLTVNFKLDTGTLCGQIVSTVTENADPITVTAGKIKLTVFLLVNGELAGSVTQAFPVM